MKLWPIQRLNLRLDEGFLDCVRFGHGPKSLVLIPGLTLRGVRESALPLAWLYRLFTQDYTVYVFDKKSNLPAETTIQQLAGHLAQAMERLALKQADVVGVSQGGMIAQALALSRPDLVHQLVLAVTACRPNKTMEQAINGWISLVQQGDSLALAQDFLEKLYSPAYCKKYRLWLPLLAKLAKPQHPGRFVTLAQACLGWDAYAQLPQICCPVLVIGGRQDKVVSAAASIELSQRLQCPLLLYPDLGHAAYEEAPDFNWRVLEFLRANR